MGQESLLERFHALRAEYIELQNQKDVLLQWAKPQLMATYASSIGAEQVALLQMQLRIKALKRKVEMVRGVMARNEKLDVNAIELQVAGELADAEKAIMEETQLIEQSKLLLDNLVSQKDSNELRKIYVQLAKKLHPDVNPDVTATHQQIWQEVQDAYNECDLERLKSLEVIYAAELATAEQSIENWAPEIIEERNNTLVTGIAKLRIQILDIKSEFPFTMEANLHNPEWVQAQRQEIDAATHSLLAVEQELLHEYESLVNDYDGATK